MKCYFCESEMIISSVESKDDLELDGQGNIIIFNCLKCGASCEFIEDDK